MRCSKLVCCCQSVAKSMENIYPIDGFFCFSHSVDIMDPYIQGRQIFSWLRINRLGWGYRAAFQELSTSENSDPDTTTLLSATLETKAARAESAYYKTLQDFIGAELTSAKAKGIRMGTIEFISALFPLSPSPACLASWSKIFHGWFDQPVFYECLLNNNLSHNTWHNCS